MDAKTAEILCNVRSDFYRRQAASFSQTRNHPWPGWRRCVEEMAREWGQREQEPSSRRTVRLLDVACGNLRFERFLAEEYACVAWDVTAVDQCDDLVVSAMENAPFFCSSTLEADSSCSRMVISGSALDEGKDALGARGNVLGEGKKALGVCNDALCARKDAASSHIDVTYVHGDVLSDLFCGIAADNSTCEGAGDNPVSAHARGDALSCVAGEAPFDCAVAFGFMHHIPGKENRRAFLRALLSRVRPGGFVAVSFWRFMSNEGLAEKACETHERALRMLGEAAGEPAAFDVAQLEEGDFLLGWRDCEDVFRYCHHFSEEDVDALMESVSDVAEPFARFRADGRTGDLNEYLVFRAR